MPSYEKGLIGEPRLIHGSLQDWLLYPNDWNWRLQPELGGEMRAVADIGTHWLDLLTWITGKKSDRALCRSCGPGSGAQTPARALSRDLQAERGRN